MADGAKSQTFGKTKPQPLPVFEKKPQPLPVREVKPQPLPIAGQEKTASTGETESTAVNDDPKLHTPAEQAIIEDFKGAVDDGLLEFYKEAHGKATQNEAKGKFDLKAVSDRMAEDIMRLLDRDARGFKSSIDGRQAWHIGNDHGESGRADHSMSDPADVARLQYVLDNYDLAEDGGRTDAYWEPHPYIQGRQRQARVIRLSKKVNGTYYVVEAVPITKDRSVKIVSAYMLEDGKTPPGSAGNNKTGASAQPPDASAPWLTAKTDSASRAPVDGIVPQPAAESKAEIVGKAKLTTGAEADVYSALPEGWRIESGATTAPMGYTVISNGKSLFGGEREIGLIRDSGVTPQPLPVFEKTAPTP